MSVDSYKLNECNLAPKLFSAFFFQTVYFCMLEKVEIPLEIMIKKRTVKSGIYMSKTYYLYPTCKLYIYYYIII